MRIRQFLKPLILISALLSVVTAYFVYYMVYGKKGYKVLCEKRQMLQRKLGEYNVLKEKHDRLQCKVNLMQDHIDPDVLEQQAWVLLRYLSPNKFVILRPKP